MSHLDKSLEGVHAQFVDGLEMEKDWVGGRGPLEAEMASQGSSMGKSQPAEM